MFHRYNVGPGLWAHRCLNVEIHNCLFIDNAAYSVNPEFNIRDFAPGGLSVVFRENVGSYVLVSNSTFINNTAVLQEDANRPGAYTPSAVGDGGAIIVRFSEQTSNSRVKIINCTFLNNSADDIGGAIYVPMIEDVQNNSLLISNTVFENSQASVTGGAVAVDMFDVGDGNVVEFVDSKFIGNRAESGGGGISFVLEDSLSQSSSVGGSINDARRAVVAVRGCVFEGNSSPRGGAALGLISNARVDQPAMTSVLSDW